MRLKTASGELFALFIDFDSSLRATRIRSLRQLLEERRGELTEAVNAIREAQLRLNSGKADDAGLLPLLHQLRRIAGQSERDIANFIDTLEGASLAWLEKPGAANRRAP